VVDVPEPERVRREVRLPRLVARHAGDVLPKRPTELRIDGDERPAGRRRAVALGERLRKEEPEAGLGEAETQGERSQRDPGVLPEFSRGDSPLLSIPGIVAPPRPERLVLN
jgi:hypothetical protein